MSAEPVLAVRRRDAVLVTGPWLAGASGVRAALQEQAPELVCCEADELAPGEAPTVVVFVVSAAAVLTGSDCALLDAAAAHTDAVVVAVSKIDVHRNWPQMLARGQDALAAHAPRYRDVPWVGAAGAPGQGEPRIAELLDVVRERLADPALPRRNSLRSVQSRLQDAVCRHDRDAGGAGRRARVAALRQRRDTALRGRRLRRAERSVALRSRLQQARVQLSYDAGNRCAALRGELQQDVAGISRRRLPGFASRVRARVEEVIAAVDRDTAAQLADVAHALGLEAPPPAPSAVAAPAGDPPLRSRRLETRLMMLLGAGFGLGVALTLSRLFADLAPGLRMAGIVAGAVAGLAATLGVVGIRGLLHDRAVLDRWVGEVIAALRAAVEQSVTTRALVAEPVLTAALSERDEAAGRRVAEQVNRIDAELRAHARAAARAAAARDRELPALRQALAEVRAELDGGGRARFTPEGPVTIPSNEGCEPVNT